MLCQTVTAAAFTFCLFVSTLALIKWKHTALGWGQMTDSFHFFAQRSIWTDYVLVHYLCWTVECCPFSSAAFDWIYAETMAPFAPEFTRLILQWPGSAGSRTAYAPTLPPATLAEEPVIKGRRTMIIPQLLNSIFMLNLLNHISCGVVLRQSKRNV